MAANALPPVASIGSIKNTERFSMPFGIFA